jgi:GAF domain-containing protein
VNNQACRQLGIRSILAAPVVYERDLVGLLEVFSSRAFAFDDGDLAVVERLAQTVVLTLSRADVFRQE